MRTGESAESQLVGQLDSLSLEMWNLPGFAKWITESRKLDEEARFEYDDDASHMPEYGPGYMTHQVHVCDKTFKAPVQGRTGEEPLDVWLVEDLNK